MPQFIPLIRIDWQYAQASSELAAVLVDADAALDSSDHTLATFEAELHRVARAHPAIVADVLIDHGFRGYMMYRVERGDVAHLPLEERPEDALADAITLPCDEVGQVTIVRDHARINHLVGVQLGDDFGDAGDEVLDAELSELDLPLEYTDEPALRELVTRVAAAIDEGETRFVAQVDLARFLVELRPGTARVARLVFTTHRELAERLLRGDFARPPAAPVLRDPVAKYKLGLDWPEDMLHEIADEATRMDRSLSWIMQFAWQTARAQVATSERNPLFAPLDTYAGPRRAQSLFFSGLMLEQIESEANRLDASQSNVVQSAFVLARKAIAALP